MVTVPEPFSWTLAATSHRFADEAKLTLIRPGNLAVFLNFFGAVTLVPFLHSTVHCTRPLISGFDDTAI